MKKHSPKKPNKTRFKNPPLIGIFWVLSGFSRIFLIIALFHSYNDKIYKKYGLLSTGLIFKEFTALKLTHFQNMLR